MRPAVRHVEGDRGLVQRATAHLDAGGIAAERMAPVGADQQPGGQFTALSGPDRDVLRSRHDGFGVVIDAGQSGQFGRATFERLDQNSVLDIVSEHVAADLVARKAHLRRANKPPGIVDQPHHPQRRGVRDAVRPYAERVKKIDRLAEQRGGAVVGIGRALRHQHRARPAKRQADRGGETRGSAAHHGNVIGFVGRRYEIGHDGQSYRINCRLRN